MQVEPSTGAGKTVPPQFKVASIFCDYRSSYASSTDCDEPVTKMVLEIELAELLRQMKKHLTP